jgi:hypothetical protein
MLNFSSLRRRPFAIKLNWSSSSPIKSSSLKGFTSIWIPVSIISTEISLGL